MGVIGAAAAMPDLGTCGGKELVGDTDAGSRGQGRRLRLGRVLRGQAFALLGIEHGVAFEEGDFALDLLAARLGFDARNAVGLAVC